jgi:hypothetical protein
MYHFKKRQQGKGRGREAGPGLKELFEYKPVLHTLVACKIWGAYTLAHSVKCKVLEMPIIDV